MEIRVTDLMVGDWLLYKSDSLDNAFPIQITREMFNKELVVWKDRFEPIPLTPEILDKNANFHRDEKYYKYYAFSEEIDIHGNSISVEICESRGTVYWTINGNEYGITKLKYVHQLQHALKLCGIDKEIII